MTIASLEEATRLKNEIKETKHMVNALQSHYGNYIKASDYKGDNSNDASISFSSGDELYDLILDYFESKLSKLEKQFEQL